MTLDAVVADEMAGVFEQTSGKTAKTGKLFAVPISLRDANNFLDGKHRHNGRTTRDGGKFAIAVHDESGMIGVAIVGRPLARALQDGFTAEVLRVCVVDDAQKGACSFLYARCWNAWKAMGGRRIVTYIIDTETGTSLKGAGWKKVALSKPHKKGWESAGREREMLPIYTQAKFRFHMEDSEFYDSKGID
jgi:hypothetical protein